MALLASEPLCTCHLVEMTGARQSNVSNHLRVLRETGLVEAQAAGRFTYYRVRPAALRDLSAELSALAEQAEAVAGVVEAPATAERAAVSTGLLRPCE